MKLQQSIANSMHALANAIGSRSTNSVSDVPLGQRFLRFGRSDPLVSDVSRLIMEEPDKYKGYLYGAIRTRGNLVAQLAKSNLKVNAAGNIENAQKKLKKPVIHPYQPIINTSKDFSNTMFWRTISTFLDLKGVYWLMAVRTVAENRIGKIQYFKLLNPYQLERVVSYEDGVMVVEGYRESRGGWSRDIPKEMIIPIEDLNPFPDVYDTYGMTDAAKDSQFTLRQAGDYTRTTLRNNVRSSGIVSTDLELTPDQLKNFKARIMDGRKGEPIFTDAKGNVKYDDMQINMDKAALKTVNQMSLEELIAVSGMSRTVFGIEQSGVTRDTARVQKDQLIEFHVIPQLQLIIDALNQDYKNYYEPEYQKNEYEIEIDSPLKGDRESEQTDVKVRQSSFDLFNSLVAKGYDRTLSAKYAGGEIGLDELGDPDPSKVQTLPAAPGSDQPADDPAATGTNKDEPTSAKPPVKQSVEAKATNAVSRTITTAIEAQTGSLKSAVVNIEGAVVSAAINKVTRNQFESQDDIINASDRADLEAELETTLTVFYGVTIPLYAPALQQDSSKRTGYDANFKMDGQVNRYIQLTARRAATSHMDTILGDLLKTAQEALDEVAADRAKRLEPKPGQTPADVLAEARRTALDGPGRDEVARSLRKKYGETISKVRADVIARSETNRAFTRAQYEADRQLIEQNGLQERAYKKWVTHSDDPCPFCLHLASRPAIPFGEAFAKVGDVITVVEEVEGKATVRKLPISYEELQHGNAHPQCQCDEELEIRPA